MKPRRSFARRLLVFLFVSSILYSVVGFVVAPVVLKDQLPKRLSQELGRTVRVERVRLNPWTLALTLDGFAIVNRDGGRFLDWNHLYVNFDVTSFIHKTWRFQEITAVGPGCRVTVGKDGKLNFNDLIEKYSANPAHPSKPGWPLRINKLVVTGAQFEFNDLSRSQEFSTHLGPITFSVIDFQTSPNSNAPYEFTAATESGEKFRWLGTLSVNPLASEGEFQLTGIRPAKYAPYFRDAVKFDLLDGAVELSGRYKAAMMEDGPAAVLRDGHVHLTNLKVAPRGSSAPALELADLEIGGVDADATKRVVTVQKVAVTGGRASVHRDAKGNIDLLGMLEPVAPTETAAVTAPAPTVPPKLQLNIQALSVRGFSAIMEDLATPRRAVNTVENAEIDAQNFTLAEGAQIPLRVALALPNRGTVNLDGTAVLAPLQATGTVDVANVALASVSPYVEPMLNVRITDGAVSTKGSFRVNLPAGLSPEIEYKGDIQVSRFGLVDGTANEPLMNWSQLAIRGLTFQTTPSVISVEEVSLTDPVARVIVSPDKVLNLSRLVKTETAEAPAIQLPKTADSGKPAPKISIANVTLNNGALSFLDHSVQPEVNLSINQLVGTISGLSSENLARGKVDLKATVEGSGPIAITGQLDPLGPKKSIDLRVDVKNVDLTPLSPYSGKFAGFELARGKMFLEVSAKMENEQIDMSNLLTLRQFSFGAPTSSPEATKLPVRLAVALLKDTEGKIAIDLPVQGSLTDPNFRIGKVVMSVIVNLLTKAAVSPFSLLGSMFGGGGEELAYQDFEAGSDDLTPDNLKKLETLTKALNGRPALNLEITGGFDPKADGGVLRQRRLAQMVRSRLWDERRAADPDTPPPEQLVITPDDELEIMRKLFAEKFPNETVPSPVVTPAASPSVVPLGKRVMVPTPAAREKKGFFHRATDLVTLKSWRESRAEKKEAEASVQAANKPTTPPPTLMAPTAPAVGTGPSLEEMRARLTDTIEISTDDLRRLAARRGQRVRDYFVQQKIAGERLFLANVPNDGKGARVYLQLQ